MSISLEREVLANLILEPARLNSNNDLGEGLFPSPQYRKMFNEISRLYEEFQPEMIDSCVLSKSSGIPIEEIEKVTAGAYSLSAGHFDMKVLALKQEVLISRLYKTVQAECDLQIKTGAWSPEALDKTHDLIIKIRNLSCGDPARSFTALDKIDPRRIEWLWQGRIPRGMLTIIAGDPGLGKSFLCTWLASRLSRGEALPDHPEPIPACSTVIMSAEDSPGLALRPRAEANGADLSRIYFMEDSAFDIVADVRRLSALADADKSIQMVIIDPLNSYLGRDVDYLKDPAVRAALRPLTEFAESRNAAVIAVAHLNKKSDLDSIYRIGGSIGFVGLARSILAVTKDPDDEERRLLLPLKMNYAKRPNKLAFWIRDNLALTFDENCVEINLEEALSPIKRSAGREANQAVVWLREYLADGAQEAKNIIRAASAEGLSESAIYRAKTTLSIKTRASGFGKQRSSSWEIAEQIQ